MLKYINFDIDVSNPCALYNADKKELVGLFKSRGYAAKYIFGYRNQTFIQIVVKCVAKKLNLNPIRTKLSYKVALRNLNREQKELLGSKSYHMLNGYGIVESDFRYYS